MKQRRIGVIMAAEYFGRSKVETVANRAGARVVMMPLQTSSDPAIVTYYDLVDRWVGSLAAAFGE
jgi:hypothetical protein